MKKILSAALVCMFSVLLLAGCTDSHKSELKQAFSKTATWKSSTTDLVADISVAATSTTQAQSISFSGKIDSISNKKMHIVLTLPAILAAFAGTSDIDMYYEYTDDGKQIAYTYNGTDWAKQTSTTSSGSTLPSATADLSDAYSILIDKINFSGEEKIDGTDCYKYEITLEWDVLLDMVKKIAEKNPDAYPEYSPSTISLMKAQLTAYSPLKMTCWVDKTNVQLKQFTINATDTVKSIIKAQNSGSTAAIDYEFSKVELKLKFSNIDNVSDFTIPDAAKNAVENTSSAE